MENKVNNPEIIETEETSKKKPAKSLGRNIFEWIMTIVVAVVIALAIRTFIFEPVRVDGASMNDTLANGEIMFVSKLNYSTAWLNFPWLKDKAACDKYVIGGNPERFDVVICHYPGRGDTNFVKRVVGLPGDVIQLDNGYLTVNGVKYDELYINDEYRKGYIQNFQPYTVPEGYYFVMGDHRNNSNDSRNVGPIERNMIVGKVRYVLFPFNKIREVK